ncbi:MAG TPA: hypothetical protein VGG08_10745 [Solirubrobacteraceae bacterium]|jgi:hypothetical protein
MAFETFMRQRARATDDPAVSIQKRGTFSLNGAAYEALGSPEAIELLYDRDRKLVAMRAVDPAAESAYPLRALGKGRTWLASGKAFMNYYGLAVDHARRWVAQVEDGMLILNMNEEGTDVSLGRDREPGTVREGSATRHQDYGGDDPQTMFQPPSERSPV